MGFGGEKKAPYPNPTNECGGGNSGGFDKERAVVRRQERTVGFTTATEQPDNIFKEVRRVHWNFSSFAQDKGSLQEEKSSHRQQARTKHKIFNPLKQLVAVDRKSLVRDALNPINECDGGNSKNSRGELEPAKHPEILVPNAVKRPVRRQKPASDIFSKSFYRPLLPLNSNKTLKSYVDPLENKLRQPKGGGRIGDRKYFPAASTEWKNTIYVFNRNALYKNLPAKWLGKSLSMRVKLPNSGDILKLLIPSNIRKVICGWINHSCKVISQKVQPFFLFIKKKVEIGNRGSNSIILTSAASRGWGCPPPIRARNIVKEQRVDGSWGINFIPLRCILSKSFSSEAIRARNTLVKIPSNPSINKCRTYMSRALASSK